MIFKNFWLLMAIPLVIFVFFSVRKKYNSVEFLFPSAENIKHFKHNLKIWLTNKMIYLRMLSIILIGLSMARPQISEEAEVKKEGISILLTIDCSSTMLGKDMQLTFEDLDMQKETSGNSRQLTRIDAVRAVAKDFIMSRDDDYLGLVAFAAEAFLVCPLTFDHDWLLQSLKRVKVGLIKDGTAIGSGILSSLNSFKDIKSGNRIIILLTDGINNFGNVPPLVAAKAARAVGVKIYTIGLVSSGLQLEEDQSGRKVYKSVRIDIDEDTLKKISELTGGEYFRATNMKTLRESYSEIDKLERTNITEKQYEGYVDIFQYFLIPALILLLLDILLGNTLLRKIP